MAQRTVTVLRPLGVALLGGALGACATTVSTHIAAPRSSPTAVVTPQVTPFATPSGSPPFTPPAVGPTPEPTGVNAGSPPITYAVPAGFTLNLSTPQQVDLTSATGAEELSFAVDTATENLSGAIRTMPIGGETGYVIEDGPQQSGAYVQDVIVRHGGTQYEAVCKGYAGYNPSLLSSGCHTFLGSVAFTG